MLKNGLQLSIEGVGDKRDQFNAEKFEKTYDSQTNPATPEDISLGGLKQIVQTDFES